MKQSEALELIRIGVEALTGKEQTIDHECTSNRAAVLLLADALDVGGEVRASDAKVARDAAERIKVLEDMVERKERRIAGLDAMLSGLRNEHSKLYNDWAEATSQLELSNNGQDELREKLEKSEKDRALLGTYYTGVDATVDRLKAENTTLRAQLAKEAEARAVAEERSTKDWERIVERMATESGGYIEQIETLTRKLDRANVELDNARTAKKGFCIAWRETAKRRDHFCSEVKSLRVELAKAEESAKKAKGRGMPEGFEVKQFGSILRVLENGVERSQFCINLMDREALSAWFISRAGLDP